MTDTDDDWFPFGEEATSLVIDNGSGSIKAGFVGDDHPKAIFPSIVGRPVGKPIDYYSTVYVGNEIMQMENDNVHLTVQYPIKHGVITRWDDMEQIWHHVFYNALKIQPEEHCVLLSEAPLNPKSHKEKCNQIMFETFNTPAVYVGIQAVLAFHTTGINTGIVLDSGFGVTHSVPIYEGCVLPDAILRSIEHFNGNDLTKCVMESIKSNGSNISMDVANDIKETLCFVAPNAGYSDSICESYKLPDGRVINIGTDRFKHTERLFKKVDNAEHTNIQRMIFESILKCDVDIRDDLYRNIVVSGGNTLFKGLTARLHHEMRNVCGITTKTNGFTRKYFHKILSADVMDIIYRHVDHFKIITPSDAHGLYAAWIGGSILASLSTFQEMWVTKDEYDESGPGVIVRRGGWGF